MLRLFLDSQAENQTLKAKVRQQEAMLIEMGEAIAGLTNLVYATGDALDKERAMVSRLRERLQSVYTQYNEQLWGDYDNFVQRMREEGLL